MGYDQREGEGMKAGDMVECVDVSRGAHLTLGMYYRVLDSGDPIFISVVNNDGNCVTYFRERFKETPPAAGDYERDRQKVLAAARVKITLRPDGTPMNAQVSGVWSISAENVWRAIRECNLANAVIHQIGFVGSYGVAGEDISYAEWVRLHT